MKETMEIKVKTDLFIDQINDPYVRWKKKLSFNQCQEKEKFVSLGNE